MRRFAGFFGSNLRFAFSVSNNRIKLATLEEDLKRLEKASDERYSHLLREVFGNAPWISPKSLQRIFETDPALCDQDARMKQLIDRYRNYIEQGLMHHKNKQHSNSNRKAHVQNHPNSSPRNSRFSR